MHSVTALEMRSDIHWAAAVERDSGYQPCSNTACSSSRRYEREVSEGREEDSSTQHTAHTLHTHTHTLTHTHSPTHQHTTTHSGHHYTTHTTAFHAPAGTVSTTTHPTSAGNTCTLTQHSRAQQHHHSTQPHVTLRALLQRQSHTPKRSTPLSLTQQSPSTCLSTPLHLSALAVAFAPSSSFLPQLSLLLCDGPVSSSCSSFHLSYVVSSSPPISSLLSPLLSAVDVQAQS